MSTNCGQYRARSSSAASRAVRSSTSFLICTWTLGLALRLRYHIGFFAAPPFEAATITRSPSRRKYSGLILGSPVLRPVVVSRATGMFWKVPPIPWPPLRRYIHVLRRDAHLMKKSVYGVFRNGGGDFGMRGSYVSAE